VDHQRPLAPDGSTGWKPLPRRQLILAFVTAIFLSVDSDPTGPFGYYLIRRVLISAVALFLSWEAFKLEKAWPIGVMSGYLLIFNPFIAPSVTGSILVVDGLAAVTLCCLVLGRVFVMRDDPITVAAVRFLEAPWWSREWWPRPPSWVGTVAGCLSIGYMLWFWSTYQDGKILGTIVAVIFYLIAKMLEWIVESLEYLLLMVCVYLAYPGLVSGVRDAVKEGIEEAMRSRKLERGSHDS